MGGITTFSPLTPEWTGEEKVIAFGGGIAIKPNEATERSDGDHQHNLPIYGTG